MSGTRGPLKMKPPRRVLLTTVSLLPRIILSTKQKLSKYLLNKRMNPLAPLQKFITYITIISNSAIIYIHKCTRKNEKHRKKFFSEYFPMCNPRNRTKSK